ncbi:unnamed protein product [Durusdinium trenchii]|uniref:J domain-containing protein n=1 Tax=Durusdinium trenchii TaxID=1381693 RepID=A0ABP0LP55_9DINO
MAVALQTEAQNLSFASTDDVLRDAEDAFPAIFSVEAPRDVLGGLWSGIKCVLSGVLVGLAGVIAQPIEGARDAGVVGCFKGLGTGLLVGVFFSITGLCTGVFQALRGVAATPRAICMASRGWAWDSESATWKEPKVYSLPEEAEVLIGDDEAEEREQQEQLPRRRVVDTFYYDQLGVATNASQKEIRRAYFQKSRQCHPDKTSEENAKERFQAISEAYQVLSDAARRQEYDQRGRDAKEGFIDAKVFFSVLLGADALAPYIGRLRITEMFGQDFFERPGLNDTEFSQARRQVKLAVTLAEKLDCIRSGDRGKLQEARDEAQGILEKDPSLQRFISEIAWVYSNRADWYLASYTNTLGSWSMGAVSSRAHGRGREASQQAHTAKLALHSFWKLRRIVQEADEKEKAEKAEQKQESRAEKEEESKAPAEQERHKADEIEELPVSISSALPTFMETFWSLSSHDITSTLDKVLERVLRDGSIDVAARCERARALRELAEALQQTTKEAAAEKGGECQRFEKAFMASVARD